MKVYVVFSRDNDIIGVISDLNELQAGDCNAGIHAVQFTVDNIPKVPEEERQWCVFFSLANIDKPNVWPLIGNLQYEEGPEVHDEGVEFIVYAKDASWALTKVFDLIDDLDWEAIVTEFDERVS